MKTLFLQILYRFFYYSQLYRICRMQNKQGIVILMYHGISETESPEWTQLSVEAFDRQMAYVKKQYTTLSLSEAINVIKSQSPIPDHSVVVTFDDGYKSNFTLAADILHKYKIPATVFVTTGFINSEGEEPEFLWFDKLYHAFLTTSEKEFTQTSMYPTPLSLTTPQEKLTAAETIINHLKDKPADEKNRLVLKIVDELKPVSDVNPAYCGANWSDIKDVDSQISIGAHTIGHEILTRLPLDQAIVEIEESKTVIESHISRPVSVFAYPNGRQEDFTDEIVDAVKKAGYTGAVTTIEGVNHAGDDPFRLKRIALSSDIDYIQFALLLSGTVARIKQFFGK